MHKVTFNPENTLLQLDHRRVGRPRDHWTTLTINKAFEQLFPEDDFNPLDDMHLAHVFTKAIDREF